MHETGRPYVLVSGGFETIVRVSDEEREALHDLARSFDEMPRREPQHEESRGNGELRPGDEFNARTTWPEVLEPHGWKFVYERAGETYWRRPGKSVGISATTNHEGKNRLKVFSTSTPFDTEGTYDLFGATTRPSGSSTPRPAR